MEIQRHAHHQTHFKSAGADNQPTGNAVKTYDYAPKAGVADFDDSDWEIVRRAICKNGVETENSRLIRIG